MGLYQLIVQECNKHVWLLQTYLQMIVLSRFVISNSFIFYFFVDLVFLLGTSLRSAESIYIIIRPF